MASCQVIRGRGRATSTPISFQQAAMMRSARAITSSWSTKLISMSSWVNSGWRSARKSSSR
jgi:hypothetical protein